MKVFAQDSILYNLIRQKFEYQSSYIAKDVKIVSERLLDFI
ncbi:hypothetical protein Riv7116_6575 [Rivularia sp. PCC 7116]|nr:hypothetical protein Riv7116_6575 [Rivularia sp. PCC 7116]